MSKEVTSEQIAAGAAVKGDNGKPVGRNTAIEVFDAMVGAAPAIANKATEEGELPCGWLAGSGSDRSEDMYFRIEDAQRECDQHNEFSRLQEDFTEEDLRKPEPVYSRASRQVANKAEPVYKPQKGKRKKSPVVHIQSLNHMSKMNGFDARIFDSFINGQMLHEIDCMDSDGDRIAELCRRAFLKGMEHEQLLTGAHYE